TVIEILRHVAESPYHPTSATIIPLRPKELQMTRSSLLRAGFALILCVVPAPRSRPPAHSVIEYPLPRAKAFPHDPAVGADGIVWYTDQANSYIGRLDPATSTVTDYATPTRMSGPHGIVVAPDGGVWYTANFVGRLGRLDPATGAIKEFPLPAEARDPDTPPQRRCQGHRVVLGLRARAFGSARSRDRAGARVRLPGRRRQPALRHRDRHGRAHLVRRVGHGRARCVRPHDRAR